MILYFKDGGATTYGCDGNPVISWWRNNVDYRFWSFVDYTKHDESALSLCVTDDFGNLVKVN